VSGRIHSIRKKHVAYFTNIPFFSGVYAFLSSNFRLACFLNTNITSICLLAGFRTTMSSEIKDYKQNLCCIYNKRMTYHLFVFCISPFHKTFAGHITITNITSVGILTCMGTPMGNISTLFLNHL